MAHGTGGRDDWSGSARPAFRTAHVIVDPQDARAFVTNMSGARMTTDMPIKPRASLATS